MLLYTFRGIANRDLTPEIATKIGFIEGRRLREQEQAAKILISGDHRISTEMLKHALISGFLSAGLDVVDCGMLPTPVFSFIVRKLALPGVMITASHNPPEWNGFQFFEPDSHIYGPEREERIKSMLNVKLSLSAWRDIGSFSQKKDCVDEYISHLLGMIRIGSHLKVVLDYGGGMAATVVPLLLENLCVEFVEINSKLDPLFRGRPAEPSPEVIGELRKKVVEEKADAGFAFDGDADRVMVVDERGEVLEGDKLIFLLCQNLVDPPGPVVLTADISMAVEKILEDKGYRIIKNRWGQTFIGDTVRRKNAAFGAETNDHYMFPHLSLHADAIAATAFLCSIISQKREKLSRMFDELPNTYILREKVNYTEDLSERTADIEGFLRYHFGSFERLHPRLYLASIDESKLVLRQSPFDRYVRIFAESLHPGKAGEIIDQVKGLLGAGR